MRENIAKYNAKNEHKASPAEKGEQFLVPALMAYVQGELIFADSERFAEYFEWSLDNAPVQLTRDEFDVNMTEDGFEIDLDGDHLTLKPTDQSDQFLLDIDVDGWSEAGLVGLLAKQIRADDLRASDVLAWLSSVVQHLTTARALPLASLMRCRFILARRLKDKVDALRLTARKNAYQACLFAPDAQTEVSFDNGFRFFDGMFDGVPTYRGTKYTFAKHFLGPDRVPRFDGKGDDGAGGKEFKAAKLIDAMPEVEYWVRNVARHPNAFRLPTSGGWTYPDFVARLVDGRILIVEYKGDHLVAGAAEKQAVGELWACQDDQSNVYVLAQRDVDGKDVREQIRIKL